MILGEAVADPVSCEVSGDHFRAWWRFWGELDRIEDECGGTRIYGFENDSDPTNSRADVDDVGACFGYISAGVVEVTDDSGTFQAAAGQWFALPGGAALRLHPATRTVISQRVGYRGLRLVGGPIERRGRLRYIDGCSDTLLACPPVLGDPCLNHLHFPTGITQTEHWHPSVRSGSVASGAGWCETPAGISPLVPGMAFSIPARGLHRFLTEAQEMNVIAYHPDSDWGPTDTSHPMVNRTWVEDNTKIDNTSPAHANAEIEDRWLAAPMLS